MATSVEPNITLEFSSMTLRRPLLKDRLHGSSFLPTVLLARLEDALAATGNSIGVPYLVLTSVLAAVAAGVAITEARLPTYLALTLGGAAAFGGPSFLLRLEQIRYQRRFLFVFPDALDVIVRSVRAGLPVLEAIELAASEIAPPVGTEFRHLLDEMRVGVEMEAALKRTGNRIRVPDFRFFVVCLVFQQRTGGGLADALSNLSTVIRQRRTLRLKARALTAETRASAVIIATMPLIAGTGLFLINPQIMSSLFLDPRGRMMLVVAVACLLLGIAVMIAIIRRGPH